MSNKIRQIRVKNDRDVIRARMLGLTNDKLYEYGLGGWLSDHKQGVLGGLSALAGGVLMATGVGSGLGASMISGGSKMITGDIQQSKLNEQEEQARIQAERQALDAKIRQTASPNNNVVFERGGYMSYIPALNAELQGDESFMENDGNIYHIPESYPSHARGGVKMALEPGTRMLGNMKSPTGKTYQEEGARLSKLQRRAQQIIEGRSTPLAKRSAMKMLGKIADEYNNLFATQEQEKEMEGEQEEMAKGGWIQKAINPKHKGWCTPITKSTCTGRRRALALRFKHGDLHRKKHQTGGYAGYGQPDIEEQRRLHIQDSILNAGNSYYGIPSYFFSNYSPESLSNPLVNPEYSIPEDIPYGSYYGAPRGSGILRNEYNPYYTDQYNGVPSQFRNDYVDNNPWIVVRGSTTQGATNTVPQVSEQAPGAAAKQGAKPGTKTSAKTGQVPKIETLPELKLKPRTVAHLTSKTLIPEDLINENVKLTSVPNPPRNEAFSKILGKLGNVGYNLGVFSPILYNIGRGLFAKPDKLNESRYYNPYEGQVKQLMENRRFNINPMLEANRNAQYAYNRNVRSVAPGMGAYLANVGSGMGSRMRADAEAYAQKQNIENSYLGQQAEMLNQLGNYKSNLRMHVDDINRREAANRRNQFGTGLGQLQQALQANRQMGNMAQRDIFATSLLNDLLKNYELSPEALDYISGKTKEAPKSMFRVKK